MTMKNRLICGVLAAALMLGGCGSTNSTADTAESTAAQISASQLLDGIDDTLLDGKISMGDEKFDGNTDKFYGVELSKIEDGCILYNTDGGNADEISAVRFADGVDGEGIMKDRLDDRKATFRDYKPDELEKLEKAKVFSVGGFDILIISDRAGEFEGMLREKLA